MRPADHTHAARVQAPVNRIRARPLTS
ncbi:RNA polymerase sigma factor, partial [Xanthomonas oryzae pv. oryzae]